MQQQQQLTGGRGREEMVSIKGSVPNVASEIERNNDVSRPIATRQLSILIALGQILYN